MPESISEDVVLSTLLRESEHMLARAGVPDPAVDAQLLTAFVLGGGRGDVQAAAIRGDRIDAAVAERLRALLERRARREPLQHITGTAPFRHLELTVGPGVFVPRPETEMLAQIAIDELRAVAAPTPIAVDLGTGSGAVALAMATEVPHAHVLAAENSVQAFVYAKGNAARLAPENARVVFADLRDAFPELDGTVSVVVSNPPYVPDDAIPRDPEVRRFDPPAALYGGADGLDVIRTLSAVGLRLARPGGLIALEHGEWQGEQVRGILAADGWRECATHPDLTTRDRVTTGRRP